MRIETKVIEEYCDTVPDDCPYCVFYDKEKNNCTVDTYLLKARYALATKELERYKRNKQIKEG